MCRALQVNRTSFHDWERRAPSDRALGDAWLIEKIKTIHADSDGTYGARRVHAELRLEHGVTVGRKRVERLMRVAGISGLAAAKAPAHDGQAARCQGRTGPGRAGLSTRPARTRPGRRTSPTSRRGRGSCTSRTSRTCTRGGSSGGRWLTTCAPSSSSTRSRWRFTVVAPTPAWFTTPTRAVNTPRCCSPNAASRRGSKSRWARIGDCFDNAVCETFHATLKKERIYRHSWPTRAAARSAIFEYIEGWYNPRRRHSTLGYLSPIEFERQHADLAQLAPNGQVSRNGSVASTAPRAADGLTTRRISTVGVDFAAHGPIAPENALALPTGVRSGRPKRGQGTNGHPRPLRPVVEEQAH